VRGGQKRGRQINRRSLRFSRAVLWLICISVANGIYLGHHIFNLANGFQFYFIMNYLKTIFLCIALSDVVRTEYPRNFCVTWELSSDCVGGDNALTSTDVRLTYNYTVDGINEGSQIGDTILLKKSETLKVYNLSYPGVGEGSVTRAEYYFEQLEHGGGGCNCVDIAFNCIDDFNCTDDDCKLVTQS